MNRDVKDMEQQLRDLEARIAEQEARIPPHSVRPHQILELERLEEERDALEDALREAGRK